jgi:hypothetical protein
LEGGIGLPVAVQMPFELRIFKILPQIAMLYADGLTYLILFSSATSQFK